ncbi:MAG: DUF2461 domain-containing protein [Chloroflexi bacterium]|nr:DUF2461 domain-containing protein [Chloroflexota bacterium]
MSFNGFPAEGLAFLVELESNNNKAWFEANKQRYQTDLLEPALAFVTELGQQLARVVPDIQYDTRTDGRGTLTRIYRDVRFSQDKSPYNTHVNGLFWHGRGKKTEHPAFGFRLSADGMGLMAGLFGFPKEMLEKYRHAAATSGPELAHILATLQSQGQYTVMGEQFKRVPAGFPADHPQADLLRYAGLAVSPRPGLAPAVVQSTDLVPTCMAHFERMAPVWYWLMRLEA